MLLARQDTALFALFDAVRTEVLFVLLFVALDTLSINAGEAQSGVTLLAFVVVFRASFAKALVVATAPHKAVFAAAALALGACAPIFFVVILATNTATHFLFFFCSRRIYFQKSRP